MDKKTQIILTIGIFAVIFLFLLVSVVINDDDNDDSSYFKEGHLEVKVYSSYDCRVQIYADDDLIGSGTCSPDKPIRINLDLLVDQYTIKIAVGYGIYDYEVIYIYENEKTEITFFVE